MSFFVTMRFRGVDPKVAHDLLREHEDLRTAVLEGIYAHGMIRCTRVIGDGEFLDIDEWPSEAERDAFVAAAGPELAKWRELMGNPEVEAWTWTPADDARSF